MRSSGAIDCNNNFPQHPRQMQSSDARGSHPEPVRLKRAEGDGGWGRGSQQMRGDMRNEGRANQEEALGV